MSIQDYLNNRRNLPEWMRDFHDQQNLFRAIYQQWTGTDDTHPVLDNVDWVDAHQFTIDIFLWWMGLHGYKLQKDRAKNVEFYDPHESINHYMSERRNAINTAMKKMLDGHTKDQN